jgi:hypothetical protein
MIDEMIVIDEKFPERELHECNICDCIAEKLIMISQMSDYCLEIYICKKCLTGIVIKLGGEVKWL